MNSEKAMAYRTFSNKVCMLLIKHTCAILSVIFISVLFFGVYSVISNQLTGLPISDFLPGWSDMADYYTGINTAANVGFFSSNAGYTGYIFDNNDVSVAGSLFYGPHGAFIIIPYVIIAKIIGWGGAAPLIAHLILMTAAFIILYFCSADIKKTIIVQIVCFSFVPFIGYYFTMMMEIQMYAWGIVLTALTWAYMNKPNKANHIGMIICIVVASAIRVTNLVFGIPYFILILHELYEEKRFSNTIIKKTAIGFLSVLAVWILYILHNFLRARFKGSFLWNLTTTFNGKGKLAGFQLFVNHFLSNTVSYFNPNESVLHYVLLRYAVFGFAVLLLVRAISFSWKRKIIFKLKSIEELSLSIILFSIVFLNIAFYDIGQGRDFRVMATVFISVITYTIISGKKFFKEACVGIVLCLVFLSHFSWVNRIINRNFGEFYTNEWASHLQYEPDAKSRYENVMVDQTGEDRYYDIPPGVGRLAVLGSFTADHMAELGIRYILVRPDKSDIPTETVGALYEILATHDDWILYILKE